MAELLSPGVFIEEVPSAVQVVGPVSTSTVAIVGYTKRGPTDEATLVTNYESFVRTFGNVAKESYVGLSMAAFFANGGRRAYVVRVVPSDAVAADCKIQSKVTDQAIESGNGVLTSFSKTSGTTALKVNEGGAPIVADSFSLKYRASGVAVVAQALVKRDGSTALTMVFSGSATTKYEGRINPASIPAFDNALDAVKAGTVTIKFTLAGGAKTIPLSTSTGWIDSGTSGAGSTASLDRRTGRLTIQLAGGDVPVLADNGVAITADFTPTTATRTLTDNSGGTLSGTGLTSGSVTYADGAYTLTFAASNEPCGPIVASYTVNAWDLNPVSKGSWANNIKVEIVGNADYYTASTATYSKHNVYVYVKNDLGSYELHEIYEELDLADSTSDMFFPDVINELSDLITVTEPGGDMAPEQLAGHARSMVVAMGDEAAAAQTITSATAGTNVVLAGAKIQSRSVTITYTSAVDSTTKTIKDDGKGNLTGDVDSAYVATATVGAETLSANTLSYTTGAFNFKTSVAIKVGTAVTVTYRSAAEEAKHAEIFGDTAKSYTAGTDGTFSTGTFGRSQFTSSADLKADYKGLYALDRIDDILQVIVPDFAGDTTVTGDLLDYAASRAAQASGGDRFIILTVPKGSSASDAVDWFRYELGRFSDYAALYWPWVKVADPNANNRALVMPPLGHIAGVYARTDASKNVGKSPGGTVDGALNFLMGLEMVPTQGERDLVYPNKINPLISSPQTGIAVWGVRTISNLSEWRYINARRLFMFLEKSIYNATFWVVFESNGNGLWSRISSQLQGFLLNLFNEGYFAGNTPSEAFFVTVDETNNTSASQDQGQVIIDVGAAPNKPAEFVRFRFQQKTLT